MKLLTAAALVATMTLGAVSAAFGTSPGVQPGRTAEPARRPAASHPAMQLLLSAWPDYRARFITPEGRVVDTANRRISHSEGQGYALVLAAAADDRETFERLWSWTRRELFLREDGLASWRYDPAATPAVTDRNNATDGDILIAWGLAEAFLRWRSPEHQVEMRRIVDAVFTHAVVRTPFGPVMMPGASGFSDSEQPDGPVVNLSYWVFPALDRLQTLVPDQDWRALRRSGVLLLRTSRFGPLRLPPEWLALGSERPVPAANFERSFSYNALRIPLYIAWSSQLASEHLRPFQNFWQAAEDVGPFVIDLDTGSARERLGEPGYKMVFGLANCVLSGRRVPREVARGTNHHYYPATLHLMALLAMSERQLQCL